MLPPRSSALALLAPLLMLPLIGSAGAPTSAAQASEESRDTWTQAELEAVTATIQGQIEALRAEDYERPVEVRLTDQAGFIEHVSARIAKVSSEEALAAEEDAAKLLGLVPPAMDLWGTTFKVLEDQVGGFYDPGSDTFYLMESFTGALAKIILAHELTHALDDQLYDIDGTLTAVMQNRDAAAAFSSVVEGSGTAMMTKWMLKYGEKLSAEQTAAAASMGTESLGAAPAYVWKPLLAAYTAGNSFLDRGYRSHKKQGLSFSDVTRMAFQSPPRSTEQILHPKKYWSEDELDPPLAVEIVGRLPGDWRELDRTTLGELVLALMTEEPKEVDFSNPFAIAFMKYTNEAAEGWGGDSLLLCGLGDARLVYVATVWDSEQDATEFRAALEQRMESWTKDLAQLGDDSGVQLQPASESAPRSVRFSAWYGVTDEEAAALVGCLSVQ